ncbi:MAG: heme ABC transporter permease [Alphaproteobacteria bacterium]|nr:heme ABC transporter permease [Alphaproteobacteria bacterium]
MSLHYFANPTRFTRLAGRIQPWAGGLAALLLAVGFYLALIVVPADYQQGDTVRIMFVHVPSAWMAMFCYIFLAVASAVALIWKHPLADLAAKASAPIGAGFTFLALVTGSLWGKPMWGAWWVWDARLTSELILLFLYLGYIALTRAIDDPRRSDRAGAVVALVGVVNVPIIYFSVKWWNTLHQGASVSLTKSPSMAAIMLWAMLVMTLAFWAYAVGMAFYRVRQTILEREQDAAWVGELKEIAP